MNAANPNILAEGRPVFKTRDEYYRFREDFRKAVEPALKAQRRAKQQSEAWAMTHFVD